MKNFLADRFQNFFFDGYKEVYGHRVSRLDKNGKPCDIKLVDTEWSKQKHKLENLYFQEDYINQCQISTNANRYVWLDGNWYLDCPTFTQETISEQEKERIDAFKSRKQKKLEDDLRLEQLAHAGMENEVKKRRT